MKKIKRYFNGRTVIDVSLFAAAFFLVNFAVPEFASAQATGSGVFQSAMVKLLCQVLPGRYGAMLSAYAGAMALVGAAMGAYRAAWALVIVSVGCYIAKDFVAVLYNASC